MPERYSRGEILRHTRYLLWATRAVAAANRGWRARFPFRSDVILTRDGLHSHLFHWCVREGLVSPPRPRTRPCSAYVSVAFASHREEVIEEARNYWRACVDRELAGKHPARRT